MQSAILNHKSKVLFAILENWSQSQHSSVGKCLNKLGYICCMEYSLLKKNELAYYMHCYEKLSWYNIKIKEHIAESVYSNMNFRKYIFICISTKDWRVYTDVLRVVLYLHLYTWSQWIKCEVGMEEEFHLFALYHLYCSNFLQCMWLNLWN